MTQQNVSTHNSHKNSMQEKHGKKTFTKTVYIQVNNRI